MSAITDGPTMTPLFQILIASVYARTPQLSDLLDHLTAQTFPHQGRVQVLIDRDDCEATIGVKRTRLVQATTAKYVAFIDDDDAVSDDYVDRIMEALAEKPDAVGFTLSYTADEQPGLDAHHSSRYTEWKTTADKYERSLNHLNPVRRELALQCLPFLDGFGEDAAYAEKLAPLIASEVFLPSPPVYHYRFSRGGSLFSGGVRKVGADPGLRSFPFVSVLAREESVAA